MNIKNPDQYLLNLVNIAPVARLLISAEEHNRWGERYHPSFWEKGMLLLKWTSPVDVSPYDIHPLQQQLFT